jgi:hypothetical protein
MFILIFNGKKVHLAIDNLWPDMHKYQWEATKPGRQVNSCKTGHLLFIWHFFIWYCAYPSRKLFMTWCLIHTPHLHLWRKFWEIYL